MRHGVQAFSQKRSHPTDQQHGMRNPSRTAAHTPEADMTQFAFGEELDPDEGVEPAKKDAKLRRMDIKIDSSLT